MPAHEMAKQYCPLCYRELKRVIKTGHMFCPDYHDCEYETSKNSPPPLSEEKATREKEEKSKRDLKQRIQEMVKTALDQHGKAFVDQVVAEAINEEAGNV